MKKSRKILTVILYVVIIALIGICIVLFVIETKNNGWKIDPSKASKLGILLAGLVLSLVRLIGKTGNTPSLKKYESLYAKELGGAFSAPDQKKEKRKLLKGIACYNQNKFAKAEEYFKPLVGVCRRRDDHTAVLLFLALTYTDWKLPDKAVTTYEELLRRAPDHSTAWSNLCSLYRQEGKHDKAIHAAEEAIRFDSGNACAWNNLAQVYISANEWQKAVSPALHALEINREMYQAETALTVAYYAMGDIENSKKYFNSAVTHGANAQKINYILNGLAHGGVTFGNTEGVRDEVVKAVGHLQRDTSLPMVEVRLPAPDDGNRSRLGGAPVDKNVPCDSAGNPMKLLAAIWCSEVRGVPNFPERGVLRFYIADDDLYGADFREPAVQRNFRVLYDENEDGFDTALLNDGSVSEDFPIKEALPVRLTPAFGPVRFSDYRFSDCLNAALAKAGVDGGEDLLSEDEMEYVCEQNVYAGHRIGGYPCFEQSDPREYHPELRKYDTLLLQIVSHYMPDENGCGRELIMFGDDGGCQFLIPSEKLRARDFSDVMFWWDCG